jgi:hypothetical protein
MSLSPHNKFKLLLESATQAQRGKKMTLWVLSSLDCLSPIPKEDAVLLLGEATKLDQFYEHRAFVDAAETPSHPYAKPLSETQIIELVFSFDKVLHG